MKDRIMKSPLFQACCVCEGSKVTAVAIVVDGLKRSGCTRPYSGRLPKGSPCPCVDSPTPGFQAVGLTLEDVDAIRKSYETSLLHFERLTLELKRLARFPGTAPDAGVLDPAAAFLELKRPVIATLRRAADIRESSRGRSTSEG